MNKYAQIYTQAFHKTAGSLNKQIAKASTPALKGIVSQMDNMGAGGAVPSALRTALQSGSDPVTARGLVSGVDAKRMQDAAMEAASKANGGLQSGSSIHPAWGDAKKVVSQQSPDGVANRAYGLLQELTSESEAGNVAPWVLRKNKGIEVPGSMEESIYSLDSRMGQAARAAAEHGHTKPTLSASLRTDTMSPYTVNAYKGLNKEVQKSIDLSEKARGMIGATPQEKGILGNTPRQQALRSISRELDRPNAGNRHWLDASGIDRVNKMIDTANKGGGGRPPIFNDPRPVPLQRR